MHFTFQTAVQLLQLQYGKQTSRQRNRGLWRAELPLLATEEEQLSQASDLWKTSDLRGLPIGLRVTLRKERRLQAITLQSVTTGKPALLLLNH